MIPSSAHTPPGTPAPVFRGDALKAYADWPRPTVIVSDGAYGVNGFDGDTVSADGLPAWYEPHISAWTKYALPETTLWFWNTELGWATVHPLLVQHGWEFRNCHIWNKGIAHIAGNANTKTLRKFPVVTEVCVQYVRTVRIPAGNRQLTLKEWLRHEWKRSGLPLSLTNEACGVRNAATRKYFTQCHLWYFPPPDAFEQFVAYANKKGDKAGRPYFSLDGRRSLTGKEWAKLRAKFHCEVGVTNVWSTPSMHGAERVSARDGFMHTNQKPVNLLDRILRASSDRGDVVWEPFGGLCSTAIAALRLGRPCYSAEINLDFHAHALGRIQAELRRPFRVHNDGTTHTETSFKTESST